MEASASRLEYSVANSLYSEDSTVGGDTFSPVACWVRSPFTDSCTTLRPITRATSSSVCSLAMPGPDDRVVA